MTEKSAELRWGILGAGNICNDFVLAMRATKRNQKVGRSLTIMRCRKTVSKVSKV